MEARNNDLIEKIIPFYLFKVMVRYTNRLAQNPDFQIVPASLWKYKEYEITKNNGKNFNKYERCIGLFQKLCKLYKNDPRIDIALCRYGMEQCSNIPEWTSIWLRKKEKKCTTKLHRFICELLRSSKPYFSADDMDVTAKGEKFAKQYRVLDLYARFLEGDVINKAEEAIRFHVDERSIQRDIDDIRIYLADRKIIGLGECRNIIYDRMQKGYVMR